MLQKSKRKSRFDFQGSLYLIGSEYVTAHLYLMRIPYAGMSYLYLKQSDNPGHNRNDSGGDIQCQDHFRWGEVIVT